MSLPYAVTAELGLSGRPTPPPLARGARFPRVDRAPSQPQLMPGKPGRPQRVTKVHNGPDSKRWAIITPVEGVPLPWRVTNIIVANEIWVEKCLKAPRKAIEIGRMPDICMGWTYDGTTFAPPMKVTPVVEVGPDGMGKTSLLEASAAADGFIVVPKA